MTEDEVEAGERSTADEPATGEAGDGDDPQVDAAGAATTSASAVDRAADSFLAIEADLRGVRGDPGRRYGLATDVERVRASVVPEDYPVRITSDEALRLRVVPVDVQVTGAETAASLFFAWPPADDGDLARLLALRGIDLDEFADLHGERVPLVVEDGYLVPRLPPGGPRGDPRGVYGIVSGLVVNLCALALAGIGAGALLATPTALGALAAVNVLALPVATYLDARSLLTTTDWAQGPLFWTALAALPVVNVVSSLAYLYTRKNATPV